MNRYGEEIGASEQVRRGDSCEGAGWRGDRWEWARRSGDMCEWGSVERIITRKVNIIFFMKEISLCSMETY